MTSAPRRFVEGLAALMGDRRYELPRGNWVDFVILAIGIGAIFTMGFVGGSSKSGIATVVGVAAFLLFARRIRSIYCDLRERIERILRSEE